MDKKILLSLSALTLVGTSASAQEQIERAVYSY